MSSRHIQNPENIWHIIQICINLQNGKTINFLLSGVLWHSFATETSHSLSLSHTFAVCECAVCTKLHVIFYLFVYEMFLFSLGNFSTQIPIELLVLLLIVVAVAFFYVYPPQISQKFHLIKFIWCTTIMLMFQFISIQLSKPFIECYNSR